VALQHLADALADADGLAEVGLLVSGGDGGAVVEVDPEAVDRRVDVLHVVEGVPDERGPFPLAAQPLELVGYLGAAAVAAAGPVVPGEDARGVELLKGGVEPVAVGEVGPGALRLGTGGGRGRELFVDQHPDLVGAQRGVVLELLRDLFADLVRSIEPSGKELADPPARAISKVL
jgi:hypothetical protein